MNEFSIKDVENLCGIKAATLRIWEKRYRFLQPQRTTSGRRLFTAQELKVILLVAALYHTGMRISEINGLSYGQLKAAALRLSNDGAGSPLVNLLLESCLDFDHEQFRVTLHHGINALGMEAAVTQVLYPLLNRIGTLWLTADVRPAQEHFATGQLRNTLVAKIDALPLRPESRYHFLLFTPAQEQHEIPLLVAHYMLRKNGHRVTYAGADMNLKTVEVFLSMPQVTHVFFHLTTNLTNDSFEDYWSNLSGMCSGKTVICSGPGVKHQSVSGNAIVLQRPEDMITYSSNPALFTGSAAHNWPHRQP